MDIRQDYTDWSASYDSDRNLTRDLDQQVTREMLGALHCKTILELGCGTGKNSVLLATLSERLLALDFSEGMLRQAKAKVQSAPVLLALTDLTRTLPCRAASVDLIACNLVLEHIPDLSLVFREALRVLKDGGYFFVCELHPFRQYQGKQPVFRRGDQQITIAAYPHHISSFLDAAEQNGFALRRLCEWWHSSDEGLPPRLVSFMFEKNGHA